MTLRQGIQKVSPSRVGRVMSRGIRVCALKLTATREQRWRPV